MPDIPGIDTDYEGVIYKETESPDNVQARLDGKTHDWRPFFEPFGGDHYRLGPEYDEQVPAGTYIIIVSSPDNQGKYVLAVGKVEKFPLKEMARTIVTLPKLKQYFGKSPLTAYFNLSGLFLLIVGGVLAGLGVLFFNPAALPPRDRRQKQILRFHSAQIMAVGRVDHGRSRTAPGILSPWDCFAPQKRD